MQTMTLDFSGPTLDVSITALKDIHLALQHRIIRLAIKKIKGDLRRIYSTHIRNIMSIVTNKKPQARIHLPGNCMVTKIYERLRFSVNNHSEVGDFSYSLENPGRFPIPDINQSLILKEIPTENFLKGPCMREGFLDLEKLAWPLILRNFRPGDRFIPLGLKGFKKVKDVFIDNKIPSEERRKIPILVNGNDIVWVCGIRIDARYRVQEKTKRILRCNVE